MFFIFLLRKNSSFFAVANGLYSSFFVSIFQTIIAIFLAVAVMATRRFFFADNRLKKDFNGLSITIRSSEFAASRKANAILFFFESVWEEMIFPPVILLLGDNPSHEVKCFAVLNLDKSRPTSEIRVRIVPVFTPGILSSSTPQR